MVSAPFRANDGRRGVSRVSAYRLYHIDGGGRFSAAEWIEADSDEAALEAARSLGKSISCELWQGQRFVGRIDSGPKGSGQA